MMRCRPGSPGKSRGEYYIIPDFSAERPRLGETNVMRFARRSAADDAGLRTDEFAVLLVPQGNGFGGHATRPRL